MITGGKNVYGATLGILMLNTRFPRIPGDIGNAATWPFPVQYRIVPSASPDAVVRKNPDPLLQSFIEAGRDLIRAGCDGISTNCGFLVSFQSKLKAALDVPIATSSLLQGRSIQQTLPLGRTIGILTISAESLTQQHLDAAGIPEGTPVVGTGATSHFTTQILENQPEIDFAKARAENVAAARQLVSSHPDVGAILLECTNMVPYAVDIRRATGRPVYSIYTYLLWFQSALLPRRFSGEFDDFKEG